MMNILFTCAGRRNYLIKYFKNAVGHSDKILAADMQLSAPAMVDADMAFHVPSVYDDTYIEVLWQICKKNNVTAIISLNDLELPILAKNKEKFELINTKLIISSEEVIDVCFDKFKTYQFCLENNINAPKTYISFERAVSSIEKKELSFPVILKPRWGSASIGIELAHNMEELELINRILTIKLEKTILATASSKAPYEAIMIQEYIQGQEFGLDVINDLDGNYCQTIVKKKLAMRAGETDKALIVDDPNLSILGEKVGRLLKHIGNLDCDFFLRDSKYYLLEMNCRFGGGYPFSHEAGADLPRAIIMWLKREKVSTDILSAKPGMSFSKYDSLMPV